LLITGGNVTILKNAPGGRSINDVSGGTVHGPTTFSKIAASLTDFIGSLLFVLIFVSLIYFARKMRKKKKQ
jgi:hypothetical protein